MSASDSRIPDLLSPRGASVIESSAQWIGWMCEMSPVDAKKYHIDESARREYVAFGCAKNIHERLPGIIWFKRNKDGVLTAAPDIGRHLLRKRSLPVGP